VHAAKHTLTSRKTFARRSIRAPDKRLFDYTADPPGSHGDSPVSRPLKSFARSSRPSSLLTCRRFGRRLGIEVLEDRWLLALTSLEALLTPGAVLQSGDIVWDNWRGYESIITGTAIPANPARILVDLNTSDPLNPHLLFFGDENTTQPPLSVPANSTQVTRFQYDVHTLSGASLINGNSLENKGAAVSLAAPGVIDGSIIVTERATDEEGLPIADLEFHWIGSDFENVDHAVFSPQNFLTVSNEITLTGGAEDLPGRSFATILDKFEHAYSAAPFNTTDFTINVTTFIPGNYVPGPPQSFCITPPSVDLSQLPPQITPPHFHKVVFSGDNRGPDRLATSYRTRQLVTIIPDASADADGLKEGSVENLVGTTKAYADDALSDGIIDATDDDGVLDDCHLLHEIATATASNMAVVVTRVTNFVVSAHLFGGASNPLVSGSPEINWDFTITIDVSSSSPQWAVAGEWDGFPAVEIYINDSLIYFSSPGPGPYSFAADLIKLFPGIGDTSVSQSGTVSGTAASSVDFSFLGGASAVYHDSAIEKIMSDWNPPRNFAARVNNLRNGSGSANRINENVFLQEGKTLANDGQRDVITGAEGSDWFLFGNDEDKATELHDDEFADALDVLLSDF